MQDGLVPFLVNTHFLFFVLALALIHDILFCSLFGALSRLGVTVVVRL